MATTNKQIVLQYKLENNIPLDYPLYTYASWKAKGYQVKKGSVCQHKIALWKHKEKTIVKDGQEVKSGYCFGKTCYLFTLEQVEKIKD